MSILMNKNGYYYIRVVKNHKLIKFSTRTKDKKLAEEIYQSFLKIIIDDKIKFKINKLSNGVEIKTDKINKNSQKEKNKEKQLEIKPLYEEYIKTCELKQHSEDNIYWKKHTLDLLMKLNIIYLSDINQTNINLLLNDINNKANDTKNTYIKEIKAFLNNCIKKGYYKQEEYNKIDFPSFKKNIRDTIITKEDFEKIYNYLENKDKDFVFYLKTLYYTVSRPSEILDLTIKDIDINNKSIKIFQNKTQKYKYNPLPDDYIKIYQEYIAKNNINNYLFIGNTKGNFGKHFYGKKFYKLKQELKLDKRYNLYTIRHTAITNLLNATNDIEFVAKMAGNNPEIAIKHYVNRNMEHYREMIQKWK